jgi:hypothetical protein
MFLINLMLLLLGIKIFILQNNFGNANFKNKILKTNFISYITIYI